SSLSKCQTITSRTLLTGGSSYTRGQHLCGVQLRALTYLFWEQGDEVSLELGLYHLHHMLHFCQLAHLKPAASLVHSSSTKEGSDTFTTLEMFQYKLIQKTRVSMSEQRNSVTRDHGQRTCLQQPLKRS
ncbi:hypothetical protein A6R68_14175, partial [Neotoma lepida]